MGQDIDLSKLLLNAEEFANAGGVRPEEVNVDRTADEKIAAEIAIKRPEEPDPDTVAAFRRVLSDTAKQIDEQIIDEQIAAERAARSEEPAGRHLSAYIAKGPEFNN